MPSQKDLRVRLFLLSLNSFVIIVDVHSFFTAFLFSCLMPYFSTMSETQTDCEQSQFLLCAQDDVYSQTQFEESSNQSSSYPPPKRQKTNRNNGLWRFFSDKNSTKEMPQINLEQKGLSFIPRNRDNEECEVEVVQVLPPPPPPKPNNSSNNIMTPPRQANVSPPASTRVVLVPADSLLLNYSLGLSISVIIVGVLLYAVMWLCTAAIA